MDLFEKYTEEELRLVNVDFLELNKKPWEFSRGAKTQRRYEYPNGKLAVRVYYEYGNNPDSRSIGQPTRAIEFYDSTETIRLTYDITKELNIKQLGNLNREIRQGRMDYMETAGVQLAELAPFVPEPYKTDFVEASHCVEVINKYYYTQIDSYIKHGDLSFEQAIINETNVKILQILNLGVRPPDALFPQGLTIKQTILHQLTGEY